ncbi:hypothetical protein SAMD00019534_000850 [Acytostelium subglobosum LB1]|uniref:hypothetical protein n=1 Tax=Acytostelium subglobosum LB1 TaxID=1410327 RepID=UPI000644FEA3|nr:hypothetical protein SAMD00019534_000850 [Acytostelium subglobosum LB1]GAM16910.1 hypothetical protein SAMD00019534_000850 [Acytostelium subglobosum LB1]|eukprot:XP_012758972.1 hypothetical protein SAMD00019534_000850 [Acytostelium subglobosum LB1]
MSGIRERPRIDGDKLTTQQQQHSNGKKKHNNGSDNDNDNNGVDQHMIDVEAILQQRQEALIKKGLDLDEYRVNLTKAYNSFVTQMLPHYIGAYNDLHTRWNLEKMMDDQNHYKPMSTTSYLEQPLINHKDVETIDQLLRYLAHTTSDITTCLSDTWAYFLLYAPQPETGDPHLKILIDSLVVPIQKILSTYIYHHNTLMNDVKVNLVQSYKIKKYPDVEDFKTANEQSQFAVTFKCINLVRALRNQLYQLSHFFAINQANIEEIVSKGYN